MTDEERRHHARRLAIAYPWSAEEIAAGTKDCTTPEAMQARLRLAVNTGRTPLWWHTFLEEVRATRGSILKEQRP